MAQAQEVRRGPRLSHSQSVPTPEPSHEWSLREKLALASAVLKSGDQNWGTVSRTIKPFAERPRPADWFSQKNCAIQYNKLLESLDQPKRKRGDQDTTGQAIVKNLTAQYKEYLEQEVRNAGTKYVKKVEKIADLQSGKVPDDKVDVMYKKFLKSRERPVEVFSDDDEYTDVEDDEEVMEIDEKPSTSSAGPVASQAPTSEPAVVTQSCSKDPDSEDGMNSVEKSQENVNNGTDVQAEAGTTLGNYSAQLKNLFQTAITGTETMQRTGLLASSSTLSMLLESPPRGPGQPLPEIPSHPATSETTPGSTPATSKGVVSITTTENEEPPDVKVFQTPLSIDPRILMNLLDDTDDEEQQEPEIETPATEIKSEPSELPVQPKRNNGIMVVPSEAEIIDIKQEKEAEKVKEKEKGSVKQGAEFVETPAPRRITRSLAGGGVAERSCSERVAGSGGDSKAKQEEYKAQEESQAPVSESQKSDVECLPQSPVKEIKIELASSISQASGPVCENLASDAILLQKIEVGDKPKTSSSPTRNISQGSAISELNSGISELSQQKDSRIAVLSDTSQAKKDIVVAKETEPGVKHIGVRVAEKEQETVTAEPSELKRRDRKDSTDGTDEEIMETKRVTRRTTSRRTSEDSENLAISPAARSGGGRKRRHGKMESRVQALCNEANFFFPHQPSNEELETQSPSTTPTQITPLSATPSSNKRLTRSRAKHPTPTSLSDLMSATSGKSTPPRASSESETSVTTETGTLSGSGSRALRSRQSVKSSSETQHSDTTARPTVENGSEPSKEPPPSPRKGEEKYGPKLDKKMKQGCFSLITGLEATKESEKFKNGVTGPLAPAIKQNVTLEQIRKKVEKNIIKDVDHFKKDVQLVLLNHMMANPQNERMVSGLTQSIWSEKDQIDKSPTRSETGEPISQSQQHGPATTEADTNVVIPASGPSSSSRSRPSSTSSLSTTVSKAEKDPVVHKPPASSAASSTPVRELRKSSIHPPPEPRSTRTSESQAELAESTGPNSPKPVAKKTKRGSLARPATPPTIPQPQDEVKALRSRGQSLTLNAGLPTTPNPRRSLNPTKKRR